MPNSDNTMNCVPGWPGYPSVPPPPPCCPTCHRPYGYNWPGWYQWPYSAGNITIQTGMTSA